LKEKFPSEHQEQVGFVNWFRARFSGVLIFAIPNGEKRAITVAKRLKVEGVVRGIPDLFIPEWCLWVEMKRVQGGRLSPEQKNMIGYLESIGQTVLVGKGSKHASELVLKYIQEKGLHSFK
jgi:hypothetical protein